MTESSPVNVEFLENKAGEITGGAYLLSIVKIVNKLQLVLCLLLMVILGPSRPYLFKFFKGCLPQILHGPFLNNLSHILGLIGGTEFIYLFDSHSKDKSRNLSSSGTAVFLQLNLLHTMENYVRSVYYKA